MDAIHTLINNPKEETMTSPRKPTHIANVAREYAGGRTEWLKIGVAWAGTNGGFVAQLYATPVDGRIVFTPAEK